MGSRNQIDGPPLCHPILRAMARRFLSVLGWELEGDPPTAPQFVWLLSPHTSKKDAFIWAAMCYAFGIRPHFMANEKLFWPPYSWILKAFGGLAVHRRSKKSLVDVAVQRFAEQPRFVLAMAPEGTRHWRPRWRSGFYHIAQQARVPVVLGYADFARKCCGVGPAMLLSGEIDADMRQIAAFYETIEAAAPARQAPIRLREEAATPRMQDRGAGDSAADDGLQE